MIVQYHGTDSEYYVLWLPYTDGALGYGEWTVNEIYINGNPEEFDPDILNPGEIIEIETKLSPPVAANTTNLIVASTPNGIPASISFIR